MIELKVSREDAARLMSYARERRRKAEKGLTKFADNFDPEKGANLRAGFEAASALERYIQEQIDESDNSCQ